MIIFPSVADMVASSQPAGVYIETGGYYAGGTTGAGRYFVEVPGTTTPDEQGAAFTLSNGNIAVLQCEITPERFGAKGDGVADDNAPLVAAITAMGDGGALGLSHGATYLSGDQLTISSKILYCPGSAIIKFNGLDASEDCLTVTRSRLNSRAGLDGVSIDCNNTGRDGIVFTGEGGSDFYKMHGCNVYDAVRDGVRMETLADNAWIENFDLNSVRIKTTGRHGMSLIVNDYINNFINKGVYVGLEIRGAGQVTSGYDIYVEDNGASGPKKVSEHAFIGLQCDVAGAANHAQHAVYFKNNTAFSNFDGWTFIQSTFEDTGNSLSLDNAIGTDSAGIRGLVVQGVVKDDYLKIVDPAILTNSAFVLAAGTFDSFAIVSGAFTAESYSVGNDVGISGTYSGSITVEKGIVIGAT